MKTKPIHFVLEPLRKDSRRRAALLSATLLAMVVSTVTATEPPQMSPEARFAIEVWPLFQQRCLPCHGQKPDEIEGDLDMRSREGLLRGGGSEQPAVVPGDPNKSPLYMAITRRHEDQWSPMPPKENDRLSPQECESIRQWIAQGAPWPDKARMEWLRKGHQRSSAEEGVVVRTTGGLTRQWSQRRYDRKDVWAYQPIRRRVPPKGARHPIDAFLNARMPRGLEPAPAADRATWIRRATFDLTGLPPTPEEVRAFVEDGDPDAYRRVIRRLLDSPHYGEQWGRHWLDVVRYADSSGYANDFERPNAWRYRDYVIRSFNQDKPYDQFVREQIAGDEIDPDNPEMLIAVGFLRMGPWEQTGMSVSKVTRQMFLDDVTAAVGQVFMAHPLQCARCHDHKFDPVPTRDYYSIQAVFATTQFAERDVPFLPQENTAAFAWHRKYHELRKEANRELLKSIPKKRVTPNDFGRERIARKWKTLFDWGDDRYRPIALSVYSGKTRYFKNVNRRLTMPRDPMAEGVLEQTAILRSGDLFSPVESVRPGVLSATGIPAELPATIHGRRTAFARWLTRPDHPLTARVIVNRVWQYHFGRGIAGNPNNFGATGKKPTHPELLDWLASDFMDHGWSIKYLHELIMTSDAYRRSSTHSDPRLLKKLDPLGNSYAVFHPRRLAAEEIRDAMLAVSGELNREMGGLPVRPDMNLEAALQPRMIMGTFAPSYVPDPLPQQRNRRSIYALKLRGQRDPFFTVFNQPSLDESCERRDSSNVAPQALTLLNSYESADRALAFASRVLRETRDDHTAIVRAFELAFGRSPDPEEIAAVRRRWSEALLEQQSRKPVAREYPTEITRRAAEENTGEPFTFTETLFEYRDYVPDLEGHQVEARVRAFADVCLVLLNANEFVYVY